MNIWEEGKLVLFIAFVIPGFISLKAYQLLLPGIEKATKDQLIDAVAYSSLNYALLFIPISCVENSGVRTASPIAYYLFYFAVLFITPLLWVIIWKTLRKSKFLQARLPHPVNKPWDYVFSQRKPCWIKVVLKDGKVIGGRYAENSFASSAPLPEQIYIEETWVIGENGEFVRPKNDTAGVIILTNEISHLELRL